jgi:hypothetical protein
MPARRGCQDFFRRRQYVKSVRRDRTLPEKPKSLSISGQWRQLANIRIRNNSFTTGGLDVDPLTTVPSSRRLPNDPFKTYFGFRQSVGLPAPAIVILADDLLTVASHARHAVVIVAAVLAGLVARVLIT